MPRFKSSLRADPVQRLAQLQRNAASVAAASTAATVVEEVLTEVTGLETTLDEQIAALDARVTALEP